MTDLVVWLWWGPRMMTLNLKPKAGVRYWVERKKEKAGKKEKKKRKWPISVWGNNKTTTKQNSWTNMASNILHLSRRLLTEQYKISELLGKMIRFLCSEAILSQPVFSSWLHKWQKNWGKKKRETVSLSGRYRKTYCLLSSAKSSLDIWVYIERLLILKEKEILLGVK